MWRCFLIENVHLRTSFLRGRRFSCCCMSRTSVSLITWILPDHRGLAVLIRQRRLPPQSMGATYFCRHFSINHSSPSFLRLLIAWLFRDLSPHAFVFYRKKCIIEQPTEPLKWSISTASENYMSSSQDFLAAYSTQMSILFGSPKRSLWIKCAN